MQEKINQSLSEINEGIIFLNENAEKAKNDISCFFNEIRKILEEREYQMKIKIKEHLQKESELFKNKEKNLLDHLNRIKIFFQDYEKSMTLQDINLLENCLKRQEIILKATGQIEKITSLPHFQDLNKENEISYLSKIFSQKISSFSNNNNQQKNKNVTQVSKGISNLNHNINLNKKKSNTINQTIQNQMKDVKRFLNLLLFVCYFKNKF